MVDVIDDFLQTISNRLMRYYKADVSSGYLERMTDHLKTFFDDIIGELEDRSSTLQSQIEGKDDSAYRTSANDIFYNKQCLCVW